MEKQWNAVLIAGTEGATPIGLAEILGRPMIEYVIQALQKAGAEEICILAPGAEKVYQEALEGASQVRILSEGGLAMEAQRMENGADIVVMSADVPLVTAQELEELVLVHQEHGNAATYYMPKADTMLPVMSRGKGFCFCFRAEYLADALEAVSHYAATDVLTRVISDGGRVEQRILPSGGVFEIVRNRVQMAEALRCLQLRINREHMMAGVTIMAPENTYIAPEVQIGENTLIYPGTYLEGKTRIGKNCVIGPNSRIVSSEIGDGTEAAYSTVLESQIGRNTHVGPYAYVRPNSHIGNDVKVGDFVEIKNSNIGDGTKMSHLTYVGDADVGERINFGCGTVVVNYDGVHKFRTVIEDDVFVGCNTNLVSPVHVQKGAFIAAGSTITENVPEKALAVARARQVNKEGWISPKDRAKQEKGE